MSKSNTVIIFIVVLILGFFAYSYFTGNADNSTALKDVSPTASSTLDANGAIANTLSQNDQYLKQLIALKGINLSLDLFNDDAYKILHLYNNEIIPEPKGRENPFAPVEQGPGNYNTNPTNFQVTSTSTMPKLTPTTKTVTPVPGLSGRALPPSLKK